MTLQLKIPGTSFNNSSLPSLVTEDILCKGSLLLVDANHPWNQQPRTQTTGVFDNLAPAASAIIGSKDIDASSYNAGGAGKMILERTKRGGIHAVVSTDVVNNGGRAYYIRPSQAINDYLTANQDHSYYFSLWNNVTRPEKSTRVPFAGLTNLDNNYLYVFDNQGDLPNTNKIIDSFASSNGQVVGTGFHAIAVSGATIGWGSINNFDGGIFTVGANSNWSAKAVGPFPGQIFYRAYIEDLTVSERTYAEVEALDYANYIKEVVSVNGRYYDDVYTDPAVIG